MRGKQLPPITSFMGRILIGAKLLRSVNYCLSKIDPTSRQPKQAQRASIKASPVVMNAVTRHGELLSGRQAALIRLWVSDSPK